jgi:hypothetical protein
MQHFRLLGIAAALCMHPVAGLAQMSILPEPCIGKTGDELDRCVRDITPPQRTQSLEPADPAPNPEQMVNCLKVNPADQQFCIRRNEVILECRNQLKYPDFGQCFANYIVRAGKPVAANCQKEKPALRAQCAARNAVFGKCLADPLRYFVCIGNQG